MDIIPGKLYTKEQIREMRESPQLRGLAIQGYVLRLENGMFSFVHWTQASGGGISDKRRSNPDDPAITTLPAGRVYTADIDWGEGLTPIKKRTPAQRLDSMMIKVIEDFKAGRVMTEEQIKMFVSDATAEAWRTGRTEITADVVREVLSHFFRQAEIEQEKRDRKHVVRNYNPSDYR